MGSYRHHHSVEDSGISPAREKPMGWLALKN
jgi:hypothetical protein